VCPVTRIECVRIFTILAALFTATSALAHDFWLEPSTFRPAAGDTVTIALRVGENFAGDPVPRRPARIVRFIARDTNGIRDVPGMENEDPAGMVRVNGATVVGYEGRPTAHKISRDKFKQFLGEEGLQHLVKSQPDAEVREQFTRYAKTVIGDGTGIEQPLGFRLELVPDRDLRSYRLLFEEKPLAGALVVAIRQDDPTKKLEARTDANGQVTLATDVQDVWLVKAVHLVRAPADSGSVWESLWASVTFAR
jgi:uncharacterized GH25 family protein